MPSLKKIKESHPSAVLPRLVGGFREPSVTVRLPQRYALHLAAWADEHDITEHADVACDSLIQPPVNGFPQQGGPLGGFTMEEYDEVLTGLDSEPTLSISGWNLLLTTGEEQVHVDLHSDGTIAEKHRTAIPDLGTLKTFPRLRTVANRERDLRLAHEKARVARDVVIRQELASGTSVPWAAELTGLGEQRIYQIRDERR